MNDTEVLQKYYDRCSRSKGYYGVRMTKREAEIFWKNSGIFGVISVIFMLGILFLPPLFFILLMIIFNLF
jgi:hypothetical protein